METFPKGNIDYVSRIELEEAFLAFNEAVLVDNSEECATWEKYYGFVKRQRSYMAHLSPEHSNQAGVTI